HTRHLILNKVTNEHLLKDIQFSFIELPKFTVQMHELDTPIDKWTYFIKHSEELHVIPDFANEDEGLKTAFMEADKYQWSKEELKAYDNVGIKEQDERGEKEIIAQKAEKKGKMDVAKKMKDRGMPNKDISDLTGLTEDEIDML
ncbi:MAG: PD-(D/E)XK nuclease family transposase, partial [Flavobacteriales bacterium]